MNRLPPHPATSRLIRLRCVLTGNSTGNAPACRSPSREDPARERDIAALSAVTVALRPARLSRYAHASGRSAHFSGRTSATSPPVPTRLVSCAPLILVLSVANAPGDPHIPCDRLFGGNSATTQRLGLSRCAMWTAGNRSLSALTMSLESTVSRAASEPRCSRRC